MKAEKKEVSIKELMEENKTLRTHNQQMFAALQETELQNMFKRMDYLFKVLEFKGEFSLAFTAECSKELESLLKLNDREEK